MFIMVYEVRKNCIEKSCFILILSKNARKEI